MPAELAGSTATVSVQNVVAHDMASSGAVDLNSEDLGSWVLGFVVLSNLLTTPFMAFLKAPI